MCIEKARSKPWELIQDKKIWPRCCSSSKTSARLLRESSSVDYMAQRGDQIKRKSRWLRVVSQAGAHFSIHFLFKLLQVAITFWSANLTSKGSISSYNSSSALACIIPSSTNMNAPTTIRIGFATNRMMALLSICLAVGVGIFGTVEASDIVDNNFAFGRPISAGSGTRRKRLPGSQLKGGSGLLTIEELEKEFEAVSFGDLFFDRALMESSMSYSMSYGFGDFSMSFSYETDEGARETDVSISPEAPVGGDTMPPLVGPIIGGDTTVPLNRFTCDTNGDIVSDFYFGTSPVSDATSVDIAYSYSFETTGDDPNTVSLIEAAIVGTMVSTLLDCPAPSDGAGRTLASATSVSTYFSQVLSQDPCTSSTDGSSCYTVESTINFLLDDGLSAEEARIQALRAVKSAIDNGDYAVPSVTSISYIGPDVDSTQASITANPNAVEETPPSDQPSDSGLSPMTKAGIGLLSVGGVVLAAALMRRRSLRARRHTEHVRLKDDGSRDGESSLLTFDNDISQDSPASTPTRNGDFQPQLEHEIA